MEERLDITIEKIVLTEEPHYESPSSEPVPPVTIEIQSSVPEPNTYDTPRLTETPEEKVKNNKRCFFRIQIYLFSFRLLLMK